MALTSGDNADDATLWIDQPLVVVVLSVAGFVSTCSIMVAGLVIWCYRKEAAAGRIALRNRTAMEVSAGHPAIALSSALSTGATDGRVATAMAIAQGTPTHSGHSTVRSRSRHSATSSPKLVPTDEAGPSASSAVSSSREGSPRPRAPSPPSWLLAPRSGSEMFSSI